MISGIRHYCCVEQVLSYAQNVHEQAKQAGGSFRAVWGDHDVDNVPKLLPKPFVLPEWLSLMLVRMSFLHNSTLVYKTGTERERERHSLYNFSVKCRQRRCAELYAVSFQRLRG